MWFASIYYTSLYSSVLSVMYSTMKYQYVVENGYWTCGMMWYEMKGCDIIWYEIVWYTWCDLLDVMWWTWFDMIWYNVIPSYCCLPGSLMEIVRLIWIALCCFLLLYILYTSLKCTVLYCAVLYCAVLYRTVLYYSALECADPLFHLGRFADTLLFLSSYSR